MTNELAEEYRELKRNLIPILLQTCGKERLCDAVDKWLLVKLGDLYDMSDSDVTVSGSLITMSIDGHKVTARHKVSAGVNYVQLTGHFPRYFWKGFANLLTK